MAFNNPPPDTKPRPSTPMRGPVQSLVQAEQLMQIAFVLPCAMVLCWGAGWWIDHHFHTRWAAITGLILGIIAGMVSAIRLALSIGNAGSRNSGSGGSQ